MKEENAPQTPTEEEEKTAEEPKQEEPAKEEPQQAEPKENLNDLVTSIRKGYEEKLAKQKKEYEGRLKEREEVITQLLNGEKAETETSIADLINKKRENYLKKW